jgi:hypothetical protein
MYDLSVYYSRGGKTVPDGGVASMDLIVLFIVVGLVLMVVGVFWAVQLFSKGIHLLWALLINTILGLVLIFLTNLFLSPPIPINVLTILISAIGGVVGWLIILILHLLGVAFV